MRIVDRATFLAMPAGTVFTKYEPCCFGELTIKGETTISGHDFLTQEIADAIDCTGSDDFAEKLFSSQETGVSLAFDFDCEGRDGCFDADQLFAVWEDADVCALIARLELARVTARGGEGAE